MNAPAAIPEPAARVPSTAARLRLSASEARNPDAVIAPSAKNQNPSSGLWNHGVGAFKARAATPSLAMSSSVCLRLSLIVLVISDPFRRFFSYISYCEVFKLAPPGKEGGREPR